MKKTILFESSGTVVLEKGFEVEENAELIIRPAVF